MSWNGLVGVSPAYFISKYGTGFSIDHIIDSCSSISALGFTSMQLEIFKEEKLTSWTNEKVLYLKKEMERTKLSPSQFVAHFLMESISYENLISEHSLPKSFSTVLNIISLFENCTNLTIPVGAFSSDPNSTRTYEDIYRGLTEKLKKMVKEAAKIGKTLNLEILPGSFIQGTDGLLRLAAEPGLETLGLNFDSGHHHVIGEPLSLIPLKMGERMRATHLSDNDGKDNKSLAPGKGNINWEKLLKAIGDSLYTGALDLEIICDADCVEQVYKEARISLLDYVKTAGLVPLNNELNK